MKGRALILIFLFLAVLLFFVLPVSADTGSFLWSGSFSDEDSKGGSTTSYMNDEIGSIIIPDIGVIQTIDSVSWRYDQGQIEGSMPHSSYWVQVRYKIGSDVVGTGTYGYIKDEPNNEVVIHAIFYDCDLSDYSGKQVLTLDWVSESLIIRAKESRDVPTTSTMAYLGLYADGVKIPATDYYLSNATNIHRVSYSYSFSNVYEYEDISNNLYFKLNRDGDSKVKTIINNSDREIVNETSYAWSLMATDLEIYESDTINNTWTVDAENIFGDTDTHVINFVGVSTAEIEFNQSHYTDPENIVVNVEITNMDNDNYIYFVEMTVTLDGDVSGNFWEASGNWNVTPYITFCCGSVMFDFYSDSYDLPVWIQCNLWAKNKNTGVWTKLANTPAVLYHESVGDASISLNATYDVGDLALITWQPADEDADIIIKFTNLNTSYIHTIEPYIWLSGTQQFEVYFTNDYIGKIKVELIENGVVTAIAYTMVSSPTTPYIEWYNSKIPLGTDAYYSYYTDNSSDTISIYGPEDQLYNLFSAETGHHYLFVTTGGKDAGIWTISLFHDGTTYYNDTMSVTTAEAFVRFGGDSFEIGETINITYQLSEFTDEIWLFDANNKVVCKFTCQWGVISMGGIRTVDYPLVDDNKYGHDIVTLISAGHYKTGLWQIYIVRNGILSTESDEWDAAMVKSVIDDPADTSNEMISIFFSPEGVFLLFTACLTMMGLVAVKHPAGGGAGAVVGVGFGVYFKVLPPWMLLLMVIALVVLAGVSVAVYFRGK